MLRKGPGDSRLFMSYPVYNVKGVSTVFIAGRRLMLPHSSCMSIDDGEAVRLLNSAQKGANGSVLSAPRYLIFNYGIFSEKTINRLSELVSWLVPGVKRVRWTITFIIVFVLMLQTVTYWVSSYSAPNATVLLLIPALMIWHEIGHAAAMTRFGMRSDGIGIGIYFLFPSLYTRLSLLRIASIEERVMVYLAGIYFQGIAQIGMLVSIQYFQKDWLIPLAAINQLLIVLNLVPVLKFDGWVVSQLLIDEIKSSRCRRRFQDYFNIVSSYSLWLFFGWFVFSFASRLYYSVSTDDWSQYGVSVIVGTVVLVAVVGHYFSRKKYEHKSR